ncbi:hypothetical protein ES703_70905 [subsurface metagenome]
MYNPYVLGQQEDPCWEGRIDVQYNFIDYLNAEDEQQKQVLKGTRWLLLKNPKNFDETHNEQERLEAALELNKPLATVYYMKEDLVP